MTKNTVQGWVIGVISSVVLLGAGSAAASGHDLAVGVFLGGKNAHSTTHFVMGLEAEKSIAPMFGITAFAERTTVNPSETSLGAGLAFHPIPLMGLKVVAIPGAEFASGHTHFLFRTGAAYEFSLGPIYMGPAFYLDFANSTTAKVFGVVAGIGI